MEPAQTDSPDHLVLCLVVDEQVLDRFPTAVRYLQIGLIDEAIDTLLVVPEGSRAQSLVSGMTTFVTYRSPQWPLARWNRRAMIAQVQRKIDSLHRGAPVIVHALSGSAGPLAADVAAATSADLLLTISATAEINDPALAPCLDAAAALAAPSQRLLRAISASPLARKPAHLAGLGAVASNVPAAFSAPQLAPAIVYAGALCANCGVESLLRATKRVLGDHPNTVLFILGKGPAENALRNLAGALDLRHHVTFVGRIEHWQTVLEAADVFCLPRTQNVFREEPIHALAAGLAIVAPDDDLYDDLINEQTALLFPDHDETRLADQIRRLIDNHEFARTLAATAQSYARSNYSIAHMVADHVRIYRQVQARGNTFPMTPTR